MMCVYTHGTVSTAAIWKEVVEECRDAAEKGDVAVGDEERECPGPTGLVPEEIDLPCKGEDAIVHEHGCA